VLFDENFEVMRAAIILVKIVHTLSDYVPYTNSWKLYLREVVWTTKGVRDVTDKLRAAEKLL
jgi:hypothetical protein